MNVRSNVVSWMDTLIAFQAANWCSGQACGVTVRGPTCDTAEPGRGTAARARGGRAGGGRLSR